MGARLANNLSQVNDIDEDFISILSKGQVTLKKEITLHCGVLPLEEGWYYCLICAKHTGVIFSDMVYFDGEWAKKNFEEILFWTKPLEKIANLLSREG